MGTERALFLFVAWERKQRPLNLPRCFCTETASFECSVLACECCRITVVIQTHREHMRTRCDNINVTEVCKGEEEKCVSNGR